MPAPRTLKQRPVTAARGLGTSTSRVARTKLDQKRAAAGAPACSPRPRAASLARGRAPVRAAPRSPGGAAARSGAGPARAAGPAPAACGAGRAPPRAARRPGPRRARAARTGCRSPPRRPPGTGWRTAGWCSRPVPARPPSAAAGDPTGCAGASQQRAHHVWFKPRSDSGCPAALLPRGSTPHAGGWRAGWRCLEHCSAYVGDAHSDAQHVTLSAALSHLCQAPGAHKRLWEGLAWPGRSAMEGDTQVTRSRSPPSGPAPTRSAPAHPPANRAPPSSASAASAACTAGAGAGVGRSGLRLWRGPCPVGQHAARLRPVHRSLLPTPLRAQHVPRRRVSGVAAWRAQVARLPALPYPSPVHQKASRGSLSARRAGAPGAPYPCPRRS